MNAKPNGQENGKRFTRTSEFVLCPECGTQVPLNVVRCINGHWLFYNHGNVELRRSPMTNFTNVTGKIHFRNQPTVCSYVKQDPTSKTVDQFYPNQEVHIKAIDEDWYVLENGSFVHRDHVVLWLNHIRRQQPQMAIVVRDGGATVWGDPGFSKRIKVLPKGETVMIYERRGTACRVSKDEQHWMNGVTLQEKKEEQK